MSRSRVCASVLSLASIWGTATAMCGMAGAAVDSEASPRPGVQTANAQALQTSHLASGPVGGASSSPAPVYGDTDGLALRELVALPTVAENPGAAGATGPIVRVKVLAFNDFHGSLSTTRLLEGRPLGGAAVLASYLRAHSQGFEGRTIIAQAGDLVGASPAVSALFQDEPTIAFFERLSNGRCDREGRDTACNLVGALGNHEFDEGATEMLRLVRGGNHRRGPFLGFPYHGQAYPTLCSNVVDSRSGRTLLPAYLIKELDGVRIGVVGAVLAGATWFLTKSGIASIQFRDEATSINQSIDELKRQGVRAIVVVIHQGGRQRFSRDLARDNSSVSGEIASIVAKLDGEVDVVVSGHSHSVLSAVLPNRDGGPTLVTQAFHSGTAFADIELHVDRQTGEVTRRQGTIVSTFADAGPGLTPDPAIAKLVRSAEQAATQVTKAVVGYATTELSSDPNEHGESPLGDWIADAQRSALRTDFAFTTPAWVRADLKAGTVTWGDLFEIQPFRNPLVKVELSGTQVVALLNQQWSVESYSRVLHISGLNYRWDSRREPSDRVVDVTVRGKPIDPAKVYTATINQFLAEGGEGFTVLANVVRRVTKVSDIDALVARFRENRAVVARIDGRIQRIDVARTP